MLCKGLAVAGGKAAATLKKGHGLLRAVVSGGGGGVAGE